MWFYLISVLQAQLFEIELMTLLRTNEPLVDHLGEVCIFESSKHPLFIIELLVDLLSLLMLALLDFHVHFEPPWKASVQFDSNHQTDQSSHWAIWDGWGELDMYRTRFVINWNQFIFYYLKLFQGQWVLWIVYMTKHVKNFEGINLVMVRRVWGAAIKLADWFACPQKRQLCLKSFFFKFFNFYTGLLNSWI